VGVGAEVCEEAPLLHATRVRSSDRAMMHRSTARV
jgi:hypothetical protein